MTIAAATTERDRESGEDADLRGESHRRCDAVRKRAVHRTEDRPSRVTDRGEERRGGKAGKQHTNGTTRQLGGSQVHRERGENLGGDQRLTQGACGAILGNRDEEDQGCDDAQATCNGGTGQLRNEPERREHRKASE